MVTRRILVRTYCVGFTETSGDHVVHVAVFTKLQLCQVHLHFAVLHEHTLFHHLQTNKTQTHDYIQKTGNFFFFFATNPASCLFLYRPLGRTRISPLNWTQISCLFSFVSQAARLAQWSKICCPGWNLSLLWQNQSRMLNLAAPRGNSWGVPAYLFHRWAPSLTHACINTRSTKFTNVTGAGNTQLGFSPQTQRYFR